MRDINYAKSLDRKGLFQGLLFHSANEFMQFLNFTILLQVYSAILIEIVRSERLRIPNTK